MNEYTREILNQEYLAIVKEHPVKYHLISLDESDYALTDTMLESVPSNIDYLIIFRPQPIIDGVPKRYTNKPVRVDCSSEKLGSLNLVGIQFQCVVEGLESDLVFEHCARLEYIGIGCHKAPLFSRIQVLNRLPLKALDLQGWGIVNMTSDTFTQFMDQIRPTVNIRVWW